MRSIIFSFALLSVSAHINCSKLTSAKTTHATTLTEYEIFAQKYEAAFGEKPSDQIWNRGDKNNKASCSKCCGNACNGGSQT